MKHTFILFSLFFVSFSFSQKLNFKGTVKDQTNGSLIPFANVQIQSKSSELKTISDINGQIAFEYVNDYPITINVSYVGYENKKITINENQLLRFDLTPLVTDLGPVIIYSEKSKTTFDRQSYSSSQFKTALTGNASQLVSKLPGIVTSANGDLSFRGKSDFIVYIDGKRSQLSGQDILKQLPANQIKSVELITVPSAAMDAQGGSGIIQIITKIVKESGFFISSNLNYGASPWSNVTDKYTGYDLNNDRSLAGISIDYNTKKWSHQLVTQYSYKNVNGKRSGDARVLTKQPDNDSYFHMQAAGERPEWYKNFYLTANSTYKLNKNNNINFSYQYGERNEGRAAYYVYNNFTAPVSEINKLNETFVFNPNTDNRYATYHTFGIDWKRTLEKGSFHVAANYDISDLSRRLTNLNYDYDVSSDTADLSTALNNQSYNLSDSTPLTGYQLKMDYKHKINLFSDYAAGFQLNEVRIDGDFDFDSPVIAPTALDNSIDFKRQVWAAYFDYHYAIKRFDFRLGLRAEYNNEDTRIANTDYLTLFETDIQENYTLDKLDLFPTLFLSYDFENKSDYFVLNTIDLGISRRINRPSLTRISPFLYRRHLEVYVLGDPELEAEYYTNYNLNFNFKIQKHTANLSLFYNTVNNAIFRVNTTTTEVENADVHDVLNENVLIRSYTNAGDSAAFGTELSFDFNFSNNLSAFFSASLFDYQISGDVFGFNVDTSSFNHNWKANINYRFNPFLSATLEGLYQSATVTSQGQNDDFKQTNFALQYQFPKIKGLQLNLNVTDLFNTNVRGLDTNAFNQNNEQIFYQETAYTRQGPIVELGLQYNLNHYKKKKRKSHSVDKHFK